MASITRPPRGKRGLGVGADPAPAGRAAFRSRTPGPPDVGAEIGDQGVADLAPTHRRPVGGQGSPDRHAPCWSKSRPAARKDRPRRRRGPGCRSSRSVPTSWWGWDRPRGHWPRQCWSGACPGAGGGPRSGTATPVRRSGSWCECTIWYITVAVRPRREGLCRPTLRAARGRKKVCRRLSRSSASSPSTRPSTGIKLRAPVRPGIDDGQSSGHR